MHTTATQNQNNNTRPIFWFFGLMALVQGGFAAYVLNFLKPHLANQGVTVEQIAMLAALLFVPLAVKVLFGLVIDRFDLFGYGQRMSYMVFGLVIYGVVILGAYWAEPNVNFGLFVFLMLAAMSALTLSDTAATAYAMEVARLEEHSKVRSIFTMGRGIGLIGISFLSGNLAERFGYAAIFLLLASTMCMPLLMLFRTKDVAVYAERPAFNWRALGVMFRPKYLLYIGFLILVFFTFQGIDGLVSYYLSQDLAVGEQMLGIFGTIKGIGVVVGAIVWHLIAKKYGRDKAVLTTIVLVTVGGLWVSFTTNLNALLMLGVVLGIVTGFQRTAYITYSMGVTDLRVAASMLAVFQMVSNVGVVSSEWISTTLTKSISFSLIFQGLALFNLLLIPSFIWLSKQLEKPEIHEVVAVTTQPETSRLATQQS